MPEMVVRAPVSQNQALSETGEMVQVLGQQHQKYRGYLGGGGGELARQAGPDNHRKIDHLEEHHPQDQDHVPADDDDGQPRGDKVVDAQGHKTGTHEQLIRQGVEKGAQGRFLLPAAGDEAVRHVRDARQDKNPQSLMITLLNKQDDEERGQEDARQGDDVGDGGRGWESRDDAITIYKFNTNATRTKDQDSRRGLGRDLEGQGRVPELSKT